MALSPQRSWAPTPTWSCCCCGAASLWAMTMRRTKRTSCPRGSSYQPGGSSEAVHSPAPLPDGSSGTRVAHHRSREQWGRSVRARGSGGRTDRAGSSGPAAGPAGAGPRLCWSPRGRRGCGSQCWPGSGRCDRFLRGLGGACRAGGKGRWRGWGLISCTAPLLGGCVCSWK